MQIKENTKEIFQNAINNGIFSEDGRTFEFAGNFMYMYSEGNKDYFKHIKSRMYVCSKEDLEVLKNSFK